MKRGYYEFMSKQGISPLIATVLLIGFSITLGAIVMQFVLSETKDMGSRIEGMSAESRFCDGAEFSIEVPGELTMDLLSGTDAYSLNGVNVKNKGKFRIFGFRMSTEQQSRLYLLGKYADIEGGGLVEHGALIGSSGSNLNDNEHTITPEEQVKTYTDEPELVAYFKNSEKVSLSILPLTLAEDDKEFRLAPIILDPEKKEAVVCVDQELVVNWRELCAKHHCTGCPDVLIDCQLPS